MPEAAEVIYPVYQLGKISLQQGRVDEALAHLEICARVTPNNKGALYQLSRAYRLKGDDARADQELALFRALGSEGPDEPGRGDQRLDRIATRGAGPPPRR